MEAPWNALRGHFVRLFDRVTAVDRVALTLTALTAAVHLAVASRYDFFGDELYFIVCGQHPAFGYADQPPLVPLLSAALYALDPKVWFLRLPAVAASAGLVWLTIALTRLLGGRDTAAWIAGLGAAGAPVLAAVTAVLNTTSFEPLAWTAVAYAVARTVMRGEHRALIWAGGIAGLGLEAKYAVALWIAAIAVGVVLTPERRILAKLEPWVGLGVGVLLAAPSLLWQAAHGWPFLELLAAARYKNIVLTLRGYGFRIAFDANFVLVPVWMAGAVGPFVIPALRPARCLAIGFVALLAATFMLHGKDYYTAAAFPTAFAIGGIVAERVLGALWARTLYILLEFASTALAMPLVLPILSPAGLLAYENRLHFSVPRESEAETRSDLPVEFGYQFGWRALARQIADAYHSLPESERAGVGILVENYAEAAAVDLYGRAYGLPEAISGHNNYFFWGLRGQVPVSVLYVHGSDVWTKTDANPPGAKCGSVRLLGTTHSHYAMAFENGKQITLCAAITPDLATLWPSYRFMY